MILEPNILKVWVKWFGLGMNKTVNSFDARESCLVATFNTPLAILYDIGCVNIKFYKMD